MEYLCPGARLEVPALPDGAPSKVASHASGGSIAVFDGLHNRERQAALQWKLGLTTCIAPGGRHGRRCARANKAPADRGRLPGILPDHDLRRATRTVIAGEKNAVLEVDL